MIITIVKGSSFLDHGVVFCVATLSLNLCLILMLSLNTWLIRVLLYCAYLMSVDRCV